ncbi:MAG: ABC transporter substrate-binding protein [Chloroflexota bacterium]
MEAQVRRMRWTGYAMVALVLAMVGCGPAAPIRESAGAPTRVADDNASIVVAQAADADSLHPILISSTQSSNITRQILQGLYETDPVTGTFTPLLAESYSNPDPKTWEFKLRQGVKFHDGTPLTIDDVVYSYTLAITDPKSRMSTTKANVESAVAVDSSTVRIKTKSVYPAFLDNLASAVRIIPAGYAAQVGVDGFNKAPIGTGPYRFVEWKKDDHLTLQRFDEYWGPRPSVREIVWRPIPDAATRIASLETGQVDVIVNVPPTEAERLGSRDDLRVSKVSSMRTIYVGMNTGTGKATDVNEPLKNEKVRQAVQRAIDYQAIIRDVLRGDGMPVASTLVPQNFGFDPSLEPAPYDPVAARRLLAEAGYPDGVTLDFDVPSGRYLMDREVGEAVAVQLARAGIKTNLMVQEWGAFYEKYLGGKIKGLWLMGVGKDTTPDAHFFTYYHSKGRALYFRDAEVDGLIDTALGTLDDGARLEAFRQLQKVLLNKAHWAYLYQQTDIYGVRDRVNLQTTSNEWLYVERATVYAPTVALN